MKIGLIGCGNIGTALAMYIDTAKQFSLDYIYDIDSDKMKQLSSQLSNKPRHVERIEPTDIIIEAAGKGVVNGVLNAGSKNVMVMSTGGLIGVKIPDNINLVLPSGAIAGLDALEAIKDEITSLSLTTSKPPLGLGKDNTEKEIVFKGTVEEAVKRFPKNINVAATLYLKTGKSPLIKIVSDPSVSHNIHTLTAKGPFGSITTTTENKPSKNPKTSYLAIKSAISCLKKSNFL